VHEGVYFAFQGRATVVGECAVGAAFARVAEQDKRSKVVLRATED
jgi:hypothetical protein